MFIIKKLVLLALALIMAFYSFPAAVGGEGQIVSYGKNLAKNPGFEGEGVPATWGCDLGFETEIVHAGARSLKVVKTEDFGSIKFPIAGDAAGTEMAYSFWAALPAGAAIGSGSGSMIISCIEYVTNSGRVQKVIGESGALVAGEWIKIQGFFKIPEDAKADTAVFYLFTDRPAVKDTYYLDDIDIRALIADVSTVPPDKAVGVEPDTDITATFGGALDPDFVAADSAKMSTPALPGGVPLQSVTLSGDKKTITIKPSLPLSPGEKYTVTLSGLKGESGETVPTISFSFTVKSSVELGLQAFYLNYGTPEQSEILPYMGLSEGVITAAAGYKNNTDKEMGAKIIAALYEGDRLRDVKVGGQTVLPNTSETLTAAINVPNTFGKDYTLKQYIWGGNEMEPFALAKELKVKDIDDSLGKFSEKSIVSRGNPSRIVRAMKKAQAGETVTIGAIGGSITAGAGASADSKRYADLIADWWRGKFPGADIVYKNAGIGATGSYIGVHRVGEQLGAYNPDFVVVEFAVNDPRDASVLPAYEALITSLLYSQNRPGVMLMFMTSNTGDNAQAQHAAVGGHYDLPMASYRDAIWPEIAEGRILWDDLYADIVHPSDAGHKLVAKFVTDRLDEIYDNLDSYDMPPLDTAQKPPYAPPARYKNAAVVDRDDITPLVEDGWRAHTVGYTPPWRDSFGKGWETVQRNKPLKFEFNGASIGIVYKNSTDANMGRIEARVDGGAPITIEGYYEGGGVYTYPACRELASGLAPGKHTVEFTMIDAHHPNTSGTFFAIAGLLVAE